MFFTGASYQHAAAVSISDFIHWPIEPVAKTSIGKAMLPHVNTNSPATFSKCKDLGTDLLFLLDMTTKFLHLVEEIILWILQHETHRRHISCNTTSSTGVHIWSNIHKRTSDASKWHIMATKFHFRWNIYSILCTGKFNKIKNRQIKSSPTSRYSTVNWASLNSLM